MSNEKKDALMSDDEEPSMLDTLSSEQLARRPSFKYVYVYASTLPLMLMCRKILDDLSAADQTLQKTTSNPEQLMSSAAVLQAQQLLQQVASSSGLTNPSLLPGLLQGGTSDQLSQLSVMLPAQQQVLFHFSHTFIDNTALLDCSSPIHECFTWSSAITSFTE